MAIPIVTVDAFTNQPFAGNPAAVCMLPEPRPDEWLRHVAREMNLSATAFLVRRDDEFDLRWLTPSVEIDLCGHATLASAHVLWEEGHLPRGAQARFHTRSGLLTAERHGEWIELDFPVQRGVPAEPLPSLLSGLGIAAATAVMKNRLDYLVEVESEAELRAVKPNQTLLRQIPVRGVIVTARSDSPSFDFMSRFFAPASGIDEDPVTGSAHTALGPYWGAKLGKSEMTAYQASARGGIVRLRLAGDRIVLGGQAVTVTRATLVA
jgi:predicted PhzF superfamily epimerase YddE/YHI9